MPNSFVFAGSTSLLCSALLFAAKIMASGTIEAAFKFIDDSESDRKILDTLNGGPVLIPLTLSSHKDVRR